MVDLQLNLPAHFLDGEERNGYYVSPEMKMVWAVELDLLNEYARVCTKHNLKWFVHAGTLLGAVRHHGFIPWDGDIDVVMPRKDYEKMCQVASREFVRPYFLQNENSDPFFCKNFSKLVNLQTTCIEEADKCRPIKHAVFIDIFPYDNVPDDEGERTVMFEKLTDYHNKAWMYCNMVNFYQPKKGRGMKKRLSYFIKHLSYKYIFEEKGDYLLYMKKHLELAVSYNGCSTKRVGEVIMPPLGRHIWDKEWVEDVAYLPFEMLSVPVPVGFEHCLETSFGVDWRTPKQVASMHSGMTYDVNCSYDEYVMSHQTAK